MGRACGIAGKDDRDLAAWLRETVGEAVRTADQHDSLKRVIREMRLELEQRFKLAGIQVGPCWMAQACRQPIARWQQGCELASRCVPQAERRRG